MIVMTWKKWKEHKWRFKETLDIFRVKSSITKVRFQNWKNHWIQSWRWGELHEANTRIDQIENDITKYKQEVNDTYERLLSLERNSRDYSLRFYNISESTWIDCIAKAPWYPREWSSIATKHRKHPQDRPLQRRWHSQTNFG